jgi:hypothetical protein
VTTHGKTLGIDVEIVKHSPRDKGFVPQPKRWRVEQTIGALVLHRGPHTADAAQSALHRNRNNGEPHRQR